MRLKPAPTPSPISHLRSPIPKCPPLKNLQPSSTATADRLPFVPALLFSFQQVMAMVVGTITPAPVLAGILKFPPANTAYFVSIALLASAVGTFLHSRRYGIVGCGLLSVTGTRFAILGPLILAGQNGGLALGVGLVAPSQAAWVKTLPGWIEALLESGTAASGLPALFLNLVLPERD